jgi:NAD(P)H-flavin reductase
MIARTSVLSSRQITPTTHGIRVEKPRGLAFRPVQYVGLEIATAQGSEEYPMPLASSPTRAYLEFGVRQSPINFLVRAGPAIGRHGGSTKRCGR